MGGKVAVKMLNRTRLLNFLSSFRIRKGMLKARDGKAIEKKLFPWPPSGHRCAYLTITRREGIRRQGELV